MSTRQVAMSSDPFGSTQSLMPSNLFAPVSLVALLMTSLFSMFNKL